MIKIIFACALLSSSSICLANDISFSGKIVEDSCHTHHIEYTACSSYKISNYTQNTLQRSANQRVLTLTYF